ncbi:MAG: hypothetical protein HGA31_02735 [Candidatus Moranbacteria bacterium]|nr:hypothetical protein [Candidatus Moranbacteria bacterium]
MNGRLDKTYEYLPVTIDRHYAFSKSVEVARRELRESNITTERRSAFGPLSKRLERTVYPRSYNLFRADYLRLLVNHGRKREDGSGKFFESWEQARDDAWRFYLGIRQKFDTFGISDYRPGQSKEEKYYYSLPKLEDDIFLEFKKLSSRPTPKDSQYASQMVHEVGDTFLGKDFSVMMNYTLSYNEDERGRYVSYYDIWDLNPVSKMVELSSVLGSGKPFEIYNRIYFDEKYKFISMKKAETMTGSD